MANAIVGSAKLLLCAAMLGIPVGFMGGVYLAEYGRGPVAAGIRFAADVLNGIPSIVLGVTVYGLVVLPMGHFSTLGGGAGLARFLSPGPLRGTAGGPRRCPYSPRRDPP